MCFCVLYHSHNKQWLCPWTPLNGWSLQWLQTVFSVSRNWSFIYIMEICVRPQKVQIVACLSFFHFPFPGNRQYILKPSGEMQYFMTVAYLQQCKPLSSPDTTQSTVARGWLKSHKALWKVFIHVYYATMQKQMIQWMRLSQPCWLKLKCSVIWCLVVQSLVTDNSQKIITPPWR
jgi:hypothetical protein